MERLRRDAIILHFAFYILHSSQDPNSIPCDHELLVRRHHHDGDLRTLRRDDLDLAALGIKLDKTANKVRGEVKVISAKGSKIPVVVMPTNEELMIARDTVRVLGGLES